MPRRGQPPDDPSSAPESGTVREFTDDDVDSPSSPRGSDEKSTDPNRLPDDQGRKNEPARANEET
jgi:hypothetical protein